MASKFVGQWIEVTGVREIETLGAIPEKLTFVPGNENWVPKCIVEPITLVEFKFAPADGKIPTPMVGAAVKEFAEWVRKAATEGVTTPDGESLKLDTTRGIAFSGVMLAHIAFALGEATHLFPWAGAFEPRTGGGWVAHVHGAAHEQGDPFFLDLTAKS